MSEEVRASQPQLEELRHQLRCLKGALAFYANPKSWTCKGEGSLLSGTSLAETDRGAFAYQVLETLRSHEAVLRGQKEMLSEPVSHKTGGPS
jgi:hypothetical protein